MSHNGARGERHRVVIVGGGFGGMEAAKRLKKADVDVTVIDRHNHLLFQPLIYQVAAGALASGQVAAPQRHMLKRQANATVLMAAVTDVDVEHRHVVLDRGDRLGYDSLILACGGETSYFGHDEWQQVTCGAQDARRCGRPPRPDLRRFRGGRTRGRPRRPGRVAHLRRRRRRPDRR